MYQSKSSCIEYIKSYDLCNRCHDIKSCYKCKDYKYKYGLTHNELVNLAARYLEFSGFRVILTEPGYVSEKPDAIGFKEGCSVLIECKASRSDFLADRKKPFRNGKEKGVGNYRYYLTNPYVANIHDLPHKWNLLWAIDENTIYHINTPSSIDNHYSLECNYRFNDINLELENTLLYSWCSKKLNNYIPSSYKTGKEFKVFSYLNESEYAKEIFNTDGYCSFCIHRDNPIDKCNKGIEDNKFWELTPEILERYQGINRTGLYDTYYKDKYKNGSHCKGFEIDFNVLYSKKNDYKGDIKLDINN